MADTPLDRTDIEILRLLQKDARLSNKELADAVGLAPSTCHERLKRLRADGVTAERRDAQPLCDEPGNRGPEHAQNHERPNSRHVFLGSSLL